MFPTRKSDKIRSKNTRVRSSLVKNEKIFSPHTCGGCGHLSVFELLSHEHFCCHRGNSGRWRYLFLTGRWPNASFSRERIQCDGGHTWTTDGVPWSALKASPYMRMIIFLAVIRSERVRKLSATAGVPTLDRSPNDARQGDYHNIAVTRSAERDLHDLWLRTVKKRGLMRTISF